MPNAPISMWFTGFMADAAFLKDETFWKGILVAAIAAIGWKVLQWLKDAGSSAWHSRKRFDVAGTWVGRCWLPSYGDTEWLEIWHYSLRGDQVKLVFYAYNSATPKIYKWNGGGVFRGSKFSAYYYELNRAKYESGVLALELKGERLKGVYAQFDPKVDDEPMYVSDPNYIQTRISLPRWCKVRMLFGRPPFRTFGEVKDVHREDIKVPAKASPSPDSTRSHQRP